MHYVERRNRVGTITDPRQWTFCSVTFSYDWDKLLLAWLAVLAMDMSAESGNMTFELIRNSKSVSLTGYSLAMVKEIGVTCYTLNRTRIYRL